MDVGFSVEISSLHKERRWIGRTWSESGCFSPCRKKSRRYDFAFWFWQISFWSLSREEMNMPWTWWKNTYEVVREKPAVFLTSSSEQVRGWARKVLKDKEKGRSMECWHENNR